MKKAIIIMQWNGDLGRYEYMTTVEPTKRISKNSRVHALLISRHIGRVEAAALLNYQNKEQLP